MAKYRRYKNRLEMFLASKTGKRVLNLTYSWGAAVVILGALFKLLHLPFGNEMLFIGMITEFFVFFISGFEQPADEYKWEQVFPELDSSNPMDREEIAARRKYLMEKADKARERAEMEGDEPFQASMGANHAYAGGIPEHIDLKIHSDELDRLAESIERLNGATERLTNLGNVVDSMNSEMQTLSIDTDAITRNSESYKNQMAQLSNTLTSLNTIYELQLKGISGQIDTIENINRGLGHIKQMYEGSVIDSSAFRSENEKLTQQLTELNAVYARILNALTVNMNGAPGMPVTSTVNTPQSND